MTGGAEVSEPVAGIVIAKDSADELEDDRFIVRPGRRRTGALWAGPGYAKLSGFARRIGCRTGRGNAVTPASGRADRGRRRSQGASIRRRPMTAYLRQSNPDSTEREIASGGSVRGLPAGIRRRVRWIGRARVGNRGVRHRRRLIHAVQPARKLAHGRSGDRRAHLERQIEAHAVTWLDRQAFGNRPDARTADHPAVQEAIEQRQEWLVRNGYAQRRAATRAQLNCIPMHFSNSRLRNGQTWPEGWQASTVCRWWNCPRAARSPANTAAPSISIPASWRWSSRKKAYSFRLFQGRPNVDAGSPVELQRTSANDTTIELSSGQSMGLDMGLSLDGPGGD